MKKVLVAFEGGMLDELDELCVREHRNRSDLIREACRRYIYNARIREGKINESQIRSNPAVSIPISIRELELVGD